MSLFTIDNITQTFALPNGGEYIALKDIDLKISQGEFISLIGHSGCGKSTVLNLLAGLIQASSGGILMNGRQITDPGPDRMVVFQNYSLLPWQTVRQNISLAVDNVMQELPLKERKERVEKQIKIVGLSASADKRPAELSGGMKQRVAIARALAIEPKLLLLDEPFGALDALTRGNLQQQLMQLCQEAKITTVMVTHDVDEALLLSDRVICLTNGPEARIGQILNVNLPRPRQRLEVMENPEYYQLRGELISFLQQQRRLRQRKKPTVVSDTKAHKNEPVIVRLGYLPGLDVSPLALATELKLFDDEVIKIKCERFNSWHKLQESLVNRSIDAAITSASIPLQLNLGLGSEGSSYTAWPAITPMTISRNGNALCLAQKFLTQDIIDLGSLCSHIKASKAPFRIAVPQHHGMSELLLRHWLTSGGLDVASQVKFIVLSPLLMAGALRTEKIEAFNAGRYRVADAVEDRVGYVLATDLDIWPGHPEKVLTTSEDWADDNQTALISLCSSLMKAGELCDNPAKRNQLKTVLSQPEWLGTRSARALDRQFDCGMGESPRELLRFNQFHADLAHFPNQAEGAWILSQFSRWGWSPFPSNRYELLTRVYRNDLCDMGLQKAGYPPLSPKRAPFALSDGIYFDQDNPIDYLLALPDACKPKITRVALPRAKSLKQNPHSQA